MLVEARLAETVCGSFRQGAGELATDEMRAARSAAAAYRRGMTYAEIAAAMHLTADDISSWLGPEGAEQS